MNVFLFFVLLEHKRRIGEGSIREEYYRGLLIFCFAFELCQPRTPLLKSKAAPSFSTIHWQAISNIFTSKEQRKPSDVKNK